MASFGKVVRALRTGLLITLGHFCASAVLAPYILFRFREDPYFLNRYNGAWESFYFSIADSLGNLLLYLPVEALYTDGFTTQLAKPEIFFIEPNSELYYSLVPANSLAYGVLIGSAVAVYGVIKRRREQAI